MDQLLGLIDLVLRVRHDETVKIFILVAGMSSVRLSFTLLDGAFAANSDLGTGFILHLLQRIATRSN